jgi:hypothetical protein
MVTEVIETDVEPDDLATMWLHAMYSLGIELFVIVGEAKPELKVGLVRRFYDLLQRKFPKAYTSVTIVQGYGSDKEYPMGEDTGIKADDDKTIFQNYKAVYDRAPLTAYMMKPPREAIRWKHKCMATNVVCYGSFNWRTLKVPDAELKELMSRYASFRYVDSMTCIGEANSYQYMRNTGTPLCLFVRDMIFKWNTHIVADCTADMAKEGRSEEEKARTQKIIDNIKGNEESQMVMADVGLFLPAVDLKHVQLVACTPYPKWVESAKGNVLMYSAGSKEERRAKLMKLLDTLG